MAPNPDTLAEELVAITQNKIDIYAGLARATGRQICPNMKKNSWYLIECAWDKAGRWKLVHKNAKLFVDTRKGRIEVDRLISCVASRILGMWMSPGDDSKVQVGKLEEITKQWADKVRSEHIKVGNVWHYYQTTIQKSLEYPLLTTTVSERDCRRIECPAVQVSLKASTLPSNYQQNVFYGSPKYLGQGASRIHAIQGIKHSHAIMDHRNLDTINGKELRANIELHNIELELGTGTSLFATDYNTFNPCVTFTWLK
eukprot:1703928-Ditylum_brightwellii.AAC.1